MSTATILEPYLYENRKRKGRIQKSWLGNKKYYFYADSTRGTEQLTTAYHVALLDSGELVCTYGGFDFKLTNPPFNSVLLGIGILHHDEVF